MRRNDVAVNALIRAKVMGILLFAVLGGMLFSCSQRAEKVGTDETGVTEGKVSEESFAPQPITLTEQQKTFVDGNNAFTLKFLKMMDDADKSGGSYICSPLSITYVLGMVNDAATGTTEKELENTLGFRNGGVQAVNSFCKMLIDSLPLVDKRVQLHIANAIFLNKGYNLQPLFQQDMQAFYKAKAESLDFSSEESPKRINGWCNEQTKGMIPSIINDMNPLAVSYLLNAIYFKADWADKFEESNTETDTFNTANGVMMLPMMRQMNEYRYVKNSVFSAVELPYSNGQWRMTVMLPEAGKTTRDIVSYLAKNGMAFLSGSEWRDVDLKLPRFETESSTKDLIGMLKKMGISRVFESTAEIPNMCDDNVFISMMLQKARIRVDESGSEAAAVTVVETYAEACEEEPEPPVIFHADHPFVYVIREASTGVILFVGRFTGR
ncbi:MAG: serpin family protein [Bacteroidales bacterium]|nr:serpin family protein [Bacteroidales bacterium]